MIRAPQSFFLGFDDQAAGTSVSLTGTAQQACLLNDPILDCANPGLITAFAIQGQSILCSDLGCTFGVLRFDAGLENHRGIGIAIGAQQQVTATFAPSSSSVVRLAIGIDPVDPSAVVDVNSLEDQLNYLFGLGSSGSVAISATATATATARREGVLGPLVVDYTAAANHIIQDATVTSIKVNNLELMAGVAGSDIPLRAFAPDAVDIDGRTLAYPVHANDAVVVTYRNDDADAGDVYTARGGIIMLPARATIEQAA